MPENKVKKCITCKNTKDITNFHKRTVSPDGIDNKCKLCRKKLISHPMGLDEAADKTRIPAQEILENMGYEINNPNNPVYLQFNERMREKWGVELEE